MCKKSQKGAENQSLFAHTLPKQLPSKPYVIQEDTSNALINSAARNQLP